MRVLAGIQAVDVAARSGGLRIDDELHLSVLPADDEDPQVDKLRGSGFTHAATRFVGHHLLASGSRLPAGAGSQRSRLRCR